MVIGRVGVGEGLVVGRGVLIGGITIKVGVGVEGGGKVVVIGRVG